jgi:SAM-dependent methyltransferase
MRGDKHTDALYADVRGRFGHRQAGANGYRYEGYFRREQTVVHSLMDPGAATVLDACCGSGLMLLPLIDQTRIIFGIDFNDDACQAAARNGFPVLRSDAYTMPLGDSCIDEIINCQFFNQQRADGVAAFVDEAARVLVPGGRVIMVWRNANALIHRTAHGLLTIADRLRGQPQFPQEMHSFDAVENYLKDAGLVIAHREVSCAPLSWRSANTHGIAARVIGASCVLVGQKPH